MKEMAEKQEQEKQSKEKQEQEVQELNLDTLFSMQNKDVQSFNSFVFRSDLNRDGQTEAEIDIEFHIDPDPLLKPASVARMVGVTTQTLRTWHKEGKLKVVLTVGGHIRVRASEVARLQGQVYHPIVSAKCAEEEGFE